MSMHELEWEEQLPPIKAVKAFDDSNLKWNGIKSVDDIVRLTEDDYGQIFRDYTNDCIAYLVNCGEPYLAEVGLDVGLSTMHERIETFAPFDIAEAALKWGVPPEEVNAEAPSNVQFFNKVREDKSGKVIGEAAIFTSPEFIIQARDKPIHALANMVRVFSGVRDFANGRIRFENGMLPLRASATVAHFLNFAISDDLDLGDHLDEDAEEMMNVLVGNFPEGIRSLPGGRYSSVVSHDPWMN